MSRLPATSTVPAIRRRTSSRHPAPDAQTRRRPGGAGFGGLELVTGLSRSWSDKAHITLIDKNDSSSCSASRSSTSCSVAARSLRCCTRIDRSPSLALSSDKRRLPQSDLKTRRKSSLTWRPTTPISASRRADYDVAATPGSSGKTGNELPSAAGVERARDALADFGGGAVVVGVLGPFFKRPGAERDVLAASPRSPLPARRTA